MSEYINAFISYSHQDGDYEKRILEFTNQLRSEGIDANVDLYEEAPAEGWQRWTENRIKDANFVLIVNSKSYYEKVYDKPLMGKGVSWEVNIVYQHLYDTGSYNTKFIPIYFDKEDEKYILTPLKPFTFYNVGEQEGFDKLYWRLRGVTKSQRPPLGKLRSLPEKEQMTMFFSTPIDIAKWNSAQWRGVLYFIYKDRPPIMGLIYKNYKAAKEIFCEWKEQDSDKSLSEFINVDFIIPPFPQDCWVNSDRERNFGKGYFVYIGPNIDKSINRATKSGIPEKELLLATISRYQWMDENNGSKNRLLFEEQTKSGTGYYLMPVGIKDTSKPVNEKNLIVDFELAVYMKKVSFKRGLNIMDDDPCKVVLRAPGEDS